MGRESRSTFSSCKKSEDLDHRFKPIKLGFAIFLGPIKFVWACRHELKRPKIVVSKFWVYPIYIFIVKLLKFTLVTNLHIQPLT
jgi:hypothetical protein